MDRATWSFVLALALATRCMGAAPDEPEAQVVAGGELEPSLVDTGPATEIGDSDENQGPPAHHLPPPMPPNHGHIEPTPPDEGSPFPAGPGGSPEADKPRGWTFDPGIDLGSDPQLAVSPKFIVGVDAGKTIAFYDKTGHLLPPKPVKQGSPSPMKHGSPSPFPVRQSASQFFAMFLLPHLNGKAAINTRDVNWSIENTLSPPTDPQLRCDPADPKRFGGCVVEAYDTRVLYDRQRDCFWIESHLRNKVQTDDGNCNAKKVACVSSDKLQYKQRFEAVAVSKTNDPRDGFISILFHIPNSGDWPRLGVHHSFLTLGSNEYPKVHLYDADAIIKGQKNTEDVSLGTFASSDLGDPDHVYPVVHHDKRNEADPKAKPFFPGTGDTSDVPTFLVATSGSRVTIFAFEGFHRTATQTKPKLMSSSIDLGHDAPWLQSPAVYRDGKIYMAGSQCVNGDGRGCLHAVNIVIIPVRRDGHAKIVANKSVREGFSDFLLGGDYGRGGSYEISAIEVNKDNDYAVVYDRSDPNLVPLPWPPGLFFNPGTYYSVFLHDETGHRYEALHEASCGPVSGVCAVTNPDAAHLDVAGIAVDPSDDTTFWMSHGYAAAGTSPTPNLAPGGYKMVIGKVEPRTTAAGSGWKFP